MYKPFVAATLLALVSAVPGMATVTLVDTFDVPSLGHWYIAGPSSEIQPEGGNPGAWLAGSFINTAAPKCISGPAAGSPFVGDYRAAGVTSLGIDVQVLRGWEDTRPMSLLLVNDNDTPEFNNDDVGIFMNGGPRPAAGAGWESFDYPLDSQGSELPAGWELFRFNGEDPSDVDWNQIITDVNSVWFVFGDPDAYYFFAWWDVGVDNARITMIPEPGSLGLLGLAGLALLPRRR